MQKLLSIIVTHYDEPWELGRPFFDMLENQQSADFDSVEIILVQDGEEHALPWKELLANYHLKIKVLTIKHGGTAAARNAGLSKCTADWVMFCNFDDMFADVASLCMFLDNLPIDDYDIIWCKIQHQAKWFTGHIYINCEDSANFSQTDGKMYRVKFLREHNIKFPSSPRLYYDHMFNAIALASTQPFRIVTLTTSFYPYFKRYRSTAMRHTPEGYAEMIETTMERERNIADELKRRGHIFEYKRAIAKAVCTEYYSTYCPDRGDDKDLVTPGFIEFFRQYRNVFREVREADLDSIKSETEVEQLNIIQNRYNEHKQEFYFKNDTLTFDQWLNKMDMLADNVKLTGTLSEPAQDHVPDPAPETQENNISFKVIDTSPVVYDLVNKQVQPAPQQTQSAQQKTEPPNTLWRDPRIVVYCGTYDVYLNMIASAKSVLCTTPVDKIYFICEDDTFPYELPDIIQTINVKDQKYFPADGPNYNNSWTWMCMIRAAFPEMFPHYSKILSLDIDVVFMENVADLWDYDLTDYYLAGVPERQRQKNSADPMYINFGVVMMNLDKLRRDGIQKPLIESLNTRHFGCPEQDAYNTICANHILELPADYNYTTYSHITGDALHERIIHYAGQKFWRHYSLVKQYADLGWPEVMRRQHDLHIKEGEQQ